MGNLRNIIKLSNEDYNTLVNTGSLTKGGVTYTYNENDLYLTPDETELPDNSVTKEKIVTGLVENITLENRIIDTFIINKDSVNTKGGLYNGSGEYEPSYAYLNYKCVSLDVSNCSYIEWEQLQTTGWQYLSYVSFDGIVHSIETNSGEKYLDLKEVKKLYINFFGDEYCANFKLVKNADETNKYKNYNTKGLVFNNTKSALFVGDSITAGYTSSGSTTENGYPKLFSQHYDMTYFNEGVGGAEYCEDGEYQGNIIPKMLTQITNSTHKNVDYLFIAGGINDWQGQNSISDFKTAVDDTLTYALANYPNAQIILITPINATASFTANPKDLTIQAYRNAITEVAIAKDSSRITVVQGNEFNFPDKTNNSSFISQMFGDGLHPSELGYRTAYLYGLIGALEFKNAAGGGVVYKPTTIQELYSILTNITTNHIKNSTVILPNTKLDFSATFETYHDLPLGENVIIYGQPKSELICNYLGDNYFCKTEYSVFVKVSGGGGFSLINVNIEASRIRYCVHDENMNNDDIYENNYINCNMKLDNRNNDTWQHNCQCIGGGLGQHGIININGGSYQGNCITTSELTRDKQYDISYHNSQFANAKSIININNVYIAHTLRLSYYGSSTEMTKANINNCSFYEEPLITQESTYYNNVNIEMIEYNNIYRSETDQDLKARYLLGAYDSVETANGITTITRQTGYVNISPLLYEHGNYRETTGGHSEYGGDTGIHYLPIINGENFINNLLAVKNIEEIWSGQIGISISNDGGCWMNVGDDYTSNEKYREYLATNNIYIQYKLATPYTEQVLENQPLNTLDQKGSQWLRNEWEKGLSLWNKNILSTATNTNNGLLMDLLEDNVTYTISVNSTNAHTFKCGETQTGALSLFESIGLSHTFTKTSSMNGYYLFVLERINYTAIKDNVMLNEGDHAYPYQAYNGEIVRESEIPLSFTTDNNPPTTNATWELLGTFSVSTYTIYVWRKA